MSKGDGHGMSFVYDWQLFTEKNREYSHPIGQSKCKTYSIEDYAKGCLYYIKENSCCALNKKTCVCFTDNSKLCENMCVIQSFLSPLEQMTDTIKIIL